MGYESLSTVVVLVIVVIVIAVWLPVRTANGMKRVAEHRQDRYSPSLHIVRTENGGRFGDVNPQYAKGAAVPTSSTVRLTPEHIAHVRELRQAAVRRRRMLVAALLGVTIFVFVMAFVLHYSAWFALIPFVLLAAVLVLGANAARQARDWEYRVSRAASSSRSQASPAVRHASDDAATEVMEQRQIRRALHDAQVEQARSKALRKAVEARIQADADAKAVRTQDVAPVEGRCETSDAQASSVAAGESPSTSSSALTVHDERDETAEMSAVNASGKVLEVSAGQDLISFSLGSASSAEQQSEAPESLEIKSTRQVAKAEPVESAVAEQLIVEARQVKAEDDARAADLVDRAGASFHEREEQAQVEAPAVTSDSLGVGLESILARRGN